MFDGHGSHTYIKFEVVPPFGGFNFQPSHGAPTWPPVQVPPALLANHDPGKALLLLVSPDITQRAAEWTEFKTPEGKCYFFSNVTKQSVWDRPQALIDLESKLIL